MHQNKGGGGYNIHLTQVSKLLQSKEFIWERRSPVASSLYGGRQDMVVAQANLPFSSFSLAAVILPASSGTMCIIRP